MNKFISINYDEHNKIWSGSEMQPLYNYAHHSLGAILYGQMKNCPNKIIQIDAVEGKSITCRQALTWAIRIAKHLKTMGLGHKDIVGLAARNSTYVMPVTLGCFLNCVPLHAVNPNYEENTLAHCFGITKPQVLFCDGSDYEKILAATKSFQPLIYTICEHIDGVASVLDLLEPTEMELFYHPEKLTLGADQTVAILCSSGTTGLPKAVTMSVHKMLFINPFLTSEDVIFGFSGLDWLTGILVMVFSCYNVCTRIITNKNYNAKYFAELTKKYKITYVQLGPEHMANLTECPQFTMDNVGSIKVLQVNGGGISKRTSEKVQNALPYSLVRFTYGLTETGAISVRNGIECGNSVVKLLPNIKLRIVDEQGGNLGPNEQGEIQAYSPYYWAGYYGNPTETQRMRDSEGWFHTGDLGYVDEDGFLYVIDRQKDTCKYMGRQYWPSEIENVISELPDVVNCCVVGVYDERFGDVAGALVIKSKGSMLEEQEIVDHVRLRLKEPHKELHNGVVFVDQLPHNFNGKILRIVAKDLFIKLKNLN